MLNLLPTANGEILATGEIIPTELKVYNKDKPLLHKKCGLILKKSIFFSSFVDTNLGLKNILLRWKKNIFLL